MTKIIFFLIALHSFSSVDCATAAQSTQPSDAHANQPVPGERGNWLKKRLAVKDAQALNEQVQKDAQASKKARTQFFNEFEKIDKKINEFYATKGFVRGKMGTLVADLKADSQKEKERRITAARKRSESDDAPINFYDVQIEAIEQDVKRLEREFEQFNLDMKSIADLDSSLSERLKIVDKQIADASDTAAQSTKKLNEMWWIINDQKALDALYVIQGLADKVTSIKKYLNDTLFADFKNVIATIEKQLEQVNKQVEALEQRGLIVAHRTLRLSKKETPDVLDVVVQEAAAEAEEQPAEEDSRKSVKKESLADMVMRWVWAPIEYVVGLWQEPMPKKSTRKRRKRRPVSEETAEEAPALEPAAAPVAEKETNAK
ncbi:MAG: hypothetical protein QG604_643 [Candidatus Dependentiae bacterium]|nr:hypothetical protein [Candidatus Dependentiae bacterium]